MASQLSELLTEAKRRRVFRTAGVYLVAVWGLSQGAAELGPLFGAPDWAVRYGVIAATAFLPFVVVLAWMFDIGRGGIVRDPGDLAAEQRADADLANMTTQLGSTADGGLGGVIVRWRDGGGENAVLCLDEFFIGRGVDCRVRFYDPLVSRQHARVFHDDGAWYIEDLGSRNGTKVGEAKISKLPLAEIQSAQQDVRVNDAGPTIRLEWVAPGEEMSSAMAALAHGQSTAHIRVPRQAAPPSPRAITRN